MFYGILFSFVALAFLSMLLSINHNGILLGDFVHDINIIVDFFFFNYEYSSLVYMLYDIYMVIYMLNICTIIGLFEISFISVKMLL